VLSLKTGKRVQSRTYYSAGRFSLGKLKPLRLSENPHLHLTEKTTPPLRPRTTLSEFELDHFVRFQLPNRLAERRKHPQPKNLAFNVRKVSVPKKLKQKKYCVAGLACTVTSLSFSNSFIWAQQESVTVSTKLGAAGEKIEFCVVNVAVFLYFWSVSGEKTPQKVQPTTNISIIITEPRLWWWDQNYYFYYQSALWLYFPWYFSTLRHILSFLHRQRWNFSEIVPVFRRFPL